MNRIEKEEFVTSLVDSIKRDIIAAIPKMPDEWDGDELREYIAEKMREGTGSRLHDRDWRRRLRDYRNSVGVIAGL